MKTKYALALTIASALSLAGLSHAFAGPERSDGTRHHRLFGWHGPRHVDADGICAADIEPQMEAMLGYVRGSLDLRIEQETHWVSELNWIDRQIRNWWEVFFEWFERRQQRQQGFRLRRFDDQLIALLAHDGVLAGKFEFPGNPHRLIAPVLNNLTCRSGIIVSPLAYA